LLQKQYNYNVI